MSWFMGSAHQKSLNRVMKGCVSFIFWAFTCPTSAPEHISPGAIGQYVFQSMLWVFTFKAFPQKSVLGSLKGGLWEQCNSNCCGPTVSMTCFFSSCISQAVMGHLHTTGRQSGAQYGQWQNVITDKSPSDPSPQACQRYLESWWIEKLMVKKLGLFMNSRLLHWICWGWV